MADYEYYPVPEGKDPYLWRKAQARASFKAHALTYLFVNAGLVVIWYFTTRGSGWSFFWPIFSMLGWGIGLAAHAYGAYSSQTENAVEREYRKLKGQ
jgi:hypothetical protein